MDILEDHNRAKIIDMLRQVTKNDTDLAVLAFAIANYDGDKDDDVIEYKKRISQTIFGNISILFNVLGCIIKHRVIRVDTVLCQAARTEPIAAPKNVDTLILIMAMYKDAFGIDECESLHEIVSADEYTDMYAISVIPSNMIPFVVDSSIDLTRLQRDYAAFAARVLYFTCDTLSIGTDLEPLCFVDSLK
jgi:hypothetical protein